MDNELFMKLYKAERYVLLTDDEVTKIVEHVAYLEDILNENEIEY